MGLGNKVISKSRENYYEVLMKGPCGYSLLKEDKALV